VRRLAKPGAYATASPDAATDESMQGDLNDFEVARRGTPRKLVALALVLALAGSGAAMWLALEGQQVRLQKSLFAERQAGVDRVAAELLDLEERVKARAAELLVLQRSLAQAEAQRDAALLLLRTAEADRVKAVAAQDAALNQRSTLVATLDRDREANEHFRRELATIEKAHAVAQAQRSAAVRELEEKQNFRAAVERELAALERARQEVRQAIPLVTSEVSALLQQRDSLLGEIERGEKRLEALKAQSEREQEAIAQLREEMPALRLDAERLRRQAADSRREVEELTRQRPTLQAQVQTVQKQLEVLQTSLRQRSELLEQTEKRLSEAFVRLAESEARRATHEARAREAAGGASRAEAASR
jgi:chromosome segregation ATPase